MVSTASAATRHLATMLRSNDGLPTSVGRVVEASGFNLNAIEGTRIYEQHLASEIAEKTGGSQYPAVFVFCEKVSNLQTEKFRTFSGRIHLCMEVRVSDDHAEVLLPQLQHYMDAVTDVLDRNRGSWGSGLYYTGGYEVSFQAVKRGGKCYLQTGKVTVQIHLSAD